MSPVIAIEQKTTSKNPRSTVGTVTELYDFIRLLYARLGVAYSLYNNKKMISYSEDQIIQLIKKEFKLKEIYILSPVIKSRKGHYCGAGRPLYLLRKGELIEFDKGKNAIGYAGGRKKVFKSIYFELKKDDTFNLFSDGYTDQFGGENIKKFNRKRFRTLLTSIHKMPMDKQEDELRLSFDNWKGKHEQIDDVCVLGIKI